MKRKKSTQLLAVALTAAMLAQPVGAQMVFAEGNVDAVQQEQAVSPAAETTGAVLKSGTAVIPADADLNQVKEILGKTLVENADQVDLSSLEWEYKCEGKTGLTGLEVSGNESWGSIGGFTSSKKGIFGTTTYTHPSLATNKDATYPVRLKGTTTEVTLTKTQKLTSAILIKDNTNVNLVYNEDGSLNLNPNSLTTLTECRLEPAFAKAQAYDRFQFVRQGFFCVDCKDTKPGELVFNRIVSLKSSYVLPK